MELKKRIMMSFPVELIKKLNDLSVDKGLSKSEITILALNEYLTNANKPAGSTIEDFLKEEKLEKKA